MMKMVMILYMTNITANGIGDKTSDHIRHWKRSNRLDTILLIWTFSNSFIENMKESSTLYKEL